MTPRMQELVHRLIAPRNPASLFSASEMNELHGGILDMHIALNRKCRWNEQRRDDKGDVYMATECNVANPHKHSIGTFNYCPFCGGRLVLV